LRELRRAGGGVRRIAPDADQGIDQSGTQRIAERRECVARVTGADEGRLGEPHRVLDVFESLIQRVHQRMGAGAEPRAADHEAAPAMRREVVRRGGSESRGDRIRLG